MTGNGSISTRTPCSPGILRLDMVAEFSFQVDYAILLYEKYVDELVFILVGKSAVCLGYWPSPMP